MLDARRCNAFNLPRPAPRPSAVDLLRADMRLGRLPTGQHLAAVTGLPIEAASRLISDEMRAARG